MTGVCDRGRRNWHPVAARDLLNGAGRLGVTESDIAQLLVKGVQFIGETIAKAASSIGGFVLGLVGL